MITKLKEVSELVKNFNYQSEEDSKKFYSLFCPLFSEFDFESDGQVDFCGENYQEGKQIGISFNHYSVFNPDYNLIFEIAFDESHFKIYRGNHNGYLVPEFLILKGDEWEHFKPIFKSKLRKYFGVD